MAKAWQNPAASHNNKQQNWPGFEQLMHNFASSAKSLQLAFHSVWSPRHISISPSVYSLQDVSCWQRTPRRGGRVSSLELVGALWPFKPCGSKLCLTADKQCLPDSHRHTFSASSHIWNYTRTFALAGLHQFWQVPNHLFRSFSQGMLPQHKFILAEFRYAVEQQGQPQEKWEHRVTLL